MTEEEAVSMIKCTLVMFLFIICCSMLNVVNNLIIGQKSELSKYKLPHYYNYFHLIQFKDIVHSCLHIRDLIKYF